MAGYNEVFTNLKLSKILLKLKFYLLEIKGKKSNLQNRMVFCD